MENALNADYCGSTLVAPGLTLQYQIRKILVEGELQRIFGSGERKESIRVTRKSGLQPDLETARSFVFRTGHLKCAGAQYGSVVAEAKPILISQPSHCIPGPLEWPEPER